MDLQTTYKEMLAGAENAGAGEIIDYLSDELPYLWTTEYMETCNRITDISRIAIGSFEYLFDDSVTLEAKGLIDVAEKIEARVVAAFGTSVRLNKPRDDYRLRGWIGPSNTAFGKEWDKGHYIAHCIGGAVDQAELNVFRQRRDLNRGWSEEGRVFRRMEERCFANPGTFCFHRPVYGDQTHMPVMLEYGVLMQDRTLWVERFSNILSV